jgi:polysaccharide export outer membrane protein
MTMQKYAGPKRLRSILNLTVCAMLLTACASTGGPSLKAEQCPVPAEGSVTYVVGPGDVLQIVVWRNVELTTTVPVRPDGRISTPLVDDMIASGKTPSQLSADMEEVLGEYLRTPEVSVIVTQQGAANQIQVVGEVSTPQSISYREGLRILDVVVSVGGLSEYAAGNRGNLVRQTSTGQVECKVKIKSLMAGDMTQNIKVFPGDVLIVPETRF